MSQENVASITFIFKDGHTRVFSQDVHGEDFERIAGEFEETHKEAIASKNNDGTDTDVAPTTPNETVDEPKPTGDTSDIVPTTPVPDAPTEPEVAPEAPVEAPVVNTETPTV